MKKVVGVAAVITVIMAIVLIAFSSTVSAYAVNRTFTKEGGMAIYNGTCPHDFDDEDAEKRFTVYEGEEIRFKNQTAPYWYNVIVSGPCKSNGETVSGWGKYPVTANKFWDSSGVKTGYFFKVENTSTSYGCWFSVAKHSFSLKLDDTKVQEKASFNLTLKTNNKEEGVMKLTIEDNEGYSITNANGTDIYEVLVEYTERKFTSDPVYGIKVIAQYPVVLNSCDRKLY